MIGTVFASDVATTRCGRCSARIPAAGTLCKRCMDAIALRQAEAAQWAQEERDAASLQLVTAWGMRAIVYLGIAGMVIAWVMASR